MKKIAFLAFLLAFCVAAGRAQESRQDISISGTALIPPFVASSTDVQVHSNRGFGAMASYRFMLTPSSPQSKPTTVSRTRTNSSIMAPLFTTALMFRLACRRFRELTCAPSSSRTGTRFVEAGPAGLIFLPIVNSGLQTLDTKQQTDVGGLYGAGVAYEISPSFDIRAEYRGLVVKVPTFGVGAGSYNFTTNKWFNLFEPTVGVAYHF